MTGWLTRLRVPLLLYAIIFTYRFAFRTDFGYRELVQIAGNVACDVIVIMALSPLYVALLNARLKIIPKLLLCLVLVPGFFFVAVKLLKFLHYEVYMHTTGMNDVFRRTFNLNSYQVFDSYIVVAFGLVVVLGESYYRQWTIARREKELAEKERTQAELRFLKAQINPHFIFNTLNNVHFLIDPANDRARGLLHDFCELLRYQLYETGQEKIALRQEVQYLERYIHIQKVRKEDGFTIAFTHLGVNGEVIAPMLLVVLLENAFKYSGTGEEHFIDINLQVTAGNFLEFKIVNSVDPKVKVPGSRDGGLGLPNLSKRLEIIYGKAASLERYAENDTYKSLLKIKL